MLGSRARLPWLAVYSTVFLLANSCQRSHSSGSTPPPHRPISGDEPRTVPPPRPPSPRAPIAPTEAGPYQPIGGDEVILKTRARYWHSGQKEPASWVDSPDTKLTVVGLYAPGQACAYRVRSEAAFASSEYDAGCGMPASCDADRHCSDEAAGTKDIGSFKGAKGTKTVCTSVREEAISGGVRRSLVRTETTRWRQTDALREDHLVAKETLSCALELDGNESGDGLNPCDPPSGRKALLVRDEETLASQNRGHGSPTLEKASTGTYSVDAVSSTSTSDSGSCEAYGLGTKDAPLSITLRNETCSAGERSGSYLVLSNLVFPDPQAANAELTPADAVIPPAGSVVLMKDGFSYTTRGQDCRVEIHADAGKTIVSGTAECDPYTLVSRNGRALSLTGAKFSCRL